MQAPRYFSPQGSLSTKLDSKALAISLLLTPWHRLHCPKCRQPHTFYLASFEFQLYIIHLLFLCGILF